MKGSKGAELVEGLEIKEGEYKLVKTRFSAFFNTNLHSLLQGAGITDLVVCGNILLIYTYFLLVLFQYEFVRVLNELI